MASTARAKRARRRSPRAASSSSSPAAHRSRTQRLGFLFEGGRWDDALAAADAFIAEIAAGSPHYLEHGARIVRAQILLARDQTSDALADAARALTHAEATGEPQALNPALATSASILVLAGESERARHPAARLIQGLRTDDTLDGIAIWALEQLLDHQALTRAVEQLRQSPWRTAAEAILAHDYAQAAGIYAEIGSRPQEAFFHLRAAETLATESRRADADAQLRQALTFYRSVQATRFIREGERLLAATA